MFSHFSLPRPICKYKFLQIEPTIKVETYRSLTCVYTSPRNHNVKVELGEISFIQYILKKMISCFKQHFFSTFHLLSLYVNWNFSKGGKLLQMKLIGVLHMYSRQKNSIVKVELGDKVFIQFILIKMTNCFKQHFFTFHLFSPYVN